MTGSLATASRGVEAVGGVGVDIGSVILSLLPPAKPRPDLRAVTHTLWRAIPGTMMSVERVKSRLPNQREVGDCDQRGPMSVDDLPLPRRARLVAPVSRHLHVANSERSVAFYRDVLGFSVQNVEENFGVPASAEVANGPARIQFSEGPSDYNPPDGLF